MQQRPTVHELIEEAHAKGEYRPVVVAAILRKDGKVLLVASAKNFADWGLPQGGIDPDEPMLHALLREIEEETGITSSLLIIKHLLGWCDLDSETSRADKRGFRKGKRYFFYLLEYDGPNELAVNAAEIADYSWAGFVEAEMLMVSTRAEKRKLTTDVLTEVMRQDQKIPSP